MARWVSWARFSIALAMGSGAGGPAAKAASSAAVTSQIFTTYSSDGYHAISWLTCGVIYLYGSGCFSSGTISTAIDPTGLNVSLQRPCGMLEDEPTTKGNISTQNLYILNGNIPFGYPMFLQTWSKQQNNSNGKVTITYVSQTVLPLVGGVSVQCYMAANSGYLFIGSDTSRDIIRFTKADRALAEATGLRNVSKVTASETGYVTVAFGSGSGSEFFVFDTTGNLVEDGGGTSGVGALFIPNNVGSVTPN